MENLLDEHFKTTFFSYSNTFFGLFLLINAILVESILNVTYSDKLLFKILVNPSIFYEELLAI